MYSNVNTNSVEFRRIRIIQLSALSPQYGGRATPTEGRSGWVGDRKEWSGSGKPGAGNLAEKCCVAEKCNNKRVTRLRTEIAAHVHVAALLRHGSTRCYDMEAQSGALNGKHKVVRVDHFFCFLVFTCSIAQQAKILGKHLAERADPVDGTRPPQQHLSASRELQRGVAAE